MPQTPSNYPPGVSGNEPQIAGYPEDDPRIGEATANVSLPEDRGIYWSELADMEDVARTYLDAHPDADADQITEACQEWINQPERGRLPETYVEPADRIAEVTRDSEMCEHGNVVTEHGVNGSCPLDRIERDPSLGQ